MGRRGRRKKPPSEHPAFQHSGVYISWVGLASRCQAKWGKETRDGFLLRIVRETPDLFYSDWRARDDYQIYRRDQYQRIALTGMGRIETAETTINRKTEEGGKYLFRDVGGFKGEPVVR
jgi:hypothetical protein